MNDYLHERIIKFIAFNYKVWKGNNNGDENSDDDGNTIKRQ